MTMDRLIPQREWEALERYRRYFSHAAEAKGADQMRFERWMERAIEALREYENLVKERESHE